MTNYLINIKEKQKFIRKLTFKKLNEEVYDVMYKKTILENSRRRLSFYLLLFFLVLREQKSKKSLVYYLFENNLNKIEQLNDSFKEIWRNLEWWEYTKYKNKHWLEDLFKYDVLFYLLKIFWESEKILIEYSDFFKKNQDLLDEFNSVKEVFWNKIVNLNYEFYWTKIDDIRIDENGDRRDLSKSIFHTIHMRMSKRMDLALSYRVDIKKIVSQSPLEIELIQSIDPNIILEVWDKFNVYDYVKNTINLISTNPLLSTTVGGIFAQIAYNKLASRGLDKRKKSDKEISQKIENETLQLKNELNEQDCESLLSPLEMQIENAEYLKDKRIQELEEKVQALEQMERSRREKEEIEQEIKQRKNIEIRIEKIEITNHYHWNSSEYNVNWNVENIQNETSSSNQTN